MKKLALIIIVIVGIAASFTGCTDPNGTRRLLESQGYTNVEITGWKPLASDDCWYDTGFKAVSPTGKTVSGVVSKGLLFRPASIRFE